MKHPEQFETLVPDPQVRIELGGITLMTFWRWDKLKSKPPAGWGPPIRIGNRKFRTREMVEAVKANLIPSLSNCDSLTISKSVSL